MVGILTYISVAVFVAALLSGATKWALQDDWRDWGKIHTKEVILFVLLLAACLLFAVPPCLAGSPRFGLPGFGFALGIIALWVVISMGTAWILRKFLLLSFQWELPELRQKFIFLLVFLALLLLLLPRVFGAICASSPI